MWRMNLTYLSCAAGNVQAGLLNSMRNTVEPAGCPTRLLPVVEKIEVSERTLAG